MVADRKYCEVHPEIIVYDSGCYKCRLHVIFAEFAMKMLSHIDEAAAILMPEESVVNENGVGPPDLTQKEERVDERGC